MTEAGYLVSREEADGSDERMKKVQKERDKKKATEKI